MRISARGAARLRVVVLFFVLGAGIFATGLVVLFYAFRSEIAGSAPDTEALGLFSSKSASASSNPLALTTRQLAERAAARQNLLRIYFTTDGQKLQPQIYNLSQPLDTHERLIDVLKKLLEGPLSPTYHPVVPPGTKLRGAYIVGDLAVVDLGGPALAHRLGGPMAELLCVYSIVNTVVENVGPVHRVRILVDGQPAAVLWDLTDISQPFSANLSLVENDAVAP
jgi:hypothetical protein